MTWPLLRVFQIKSTTCSSEALSPSSFCMPRMKLLRAHAR